MTPPKLSLHQLNRALLSRQMLLERASLAPLQAVEKLVALQAQLPNPPYIGLWTRLAHFARDELTQLMHARQIVRAAWLRSTLHLIPAPLHQDYRATLLPALERAYKSFNGPRTQGVDVERLVAAARDHLNQAPRTTGELRARLLEVQPDKNGDTLAYAVRTYLPLVQIPPGGTWGSGSQASYTTAENWLGAPKDADDLTGLFRRYLAAFGPASLMDFQTWTGLTRLKDVEAQLTHDLTSYRGPDGKLLYDLPGHQLPPAATPAPPRFIPEYDNLLIAHADRTRILPEADRSKVFLSAARVRATFLVDGFVAGTWRTERSKRSAALVIEPFRPLEPATSAALAEEGERLLRFIEDDAPAYDLRFAPYNA